MNQTLLVNRQDFADLTVANIEDGALEDGCIRVSVGPWALTANNVTYMVTGDMIGYWKFFEPKAYGIDQDGTGRMPVWGYAKVIESRCADVPVGEEIYGFFPIVKTLDMRPTKMNPMGFQDGMDHRTELHSVYNTYNMLSRDPSFPKALYNIQPVLRPLFTTSFLIDDMFGEENHYEAEQIIIISASSKTALGTAFCLKQRGDVKVVGLTSAGNKSFVEGTGFYDEVVTYDDIATIDGTVKTALIDMAGNGEIMGKVYAVCGGNIVYNCMVGKSHWQGGTPPKITAGAPPAMFFAPDRAKQRFKDWGPEGFAKNLAARWMPFCQSAQSWLTVDTQDGIEAILPVYKDLLNGQVDPSKATLFSL